MRKTLILKAAVSAPGKCIRLGLISLQEGEALLSAYAQPILAPLSLTQERNLAPCNLWCWRLSFSSPSASLALSPFLLLLESAAGASLHFDQTIFTGSVPEKQDLFTEDLNFSKVERNQIALLFRLASTFRKHWVTLPIRSVSS